MGSGDGPVGSLDEGPKRGGEKAILPGSAPKVSLGNNRKKSRRGDSKKRQVPSAGRCRGEGSISPRKARKRGATVLSARYQTALGEKRARPRVHVLMQDALSYGGSRESDHFDEGGIETLVLKILGSVYQNPLAPGN